MAAKIVKHPNELFMLRERDCGEAVSWQRLVPTSLDREVS